MGELTFEVRREMSGDKDYVTGDTRKLLASDAVHLVRSGALLPKGAEAIKAMADIMGAAPDDRDGIVQLAPREAAKDAGSAPRNKDMGDAERNKGRKGASGGKATSGAAPAIAPAVAPAVTGGPATGTGTWTGLGDAGAGASAPIEGGTAQGATGDPVTPAIVATGAAGPVTGGATGAPPVARKRR